MPETVNKTKKCHLCGQAGRKMLWTSEAPTTGVGERQFVWAVCPTCDSSELGGAHNQREVKVEETEA